MEKGLEAYLMKRAKEEGGWCAKWQNLSIRGIPDRLLFLPGGRFAIIETKYGSNGLSPAQRKITALLRRLGFPVYVPRTKKEIDDIIEKTKNGF